MRVDGIDAGLHQVEVGITRQRCRRINRLSSQVQVVTCGGIAELVELVVGRERHVPGSLIGGSQLVDGHFLPSQRAVGLLHEVGGVETAALVFVLQVVLHSLFNVNGVVRVGKVVVRMFQSILAQCLTNHGIAQVERLGARVLVSTVDAVGPHVLIVAVQLLKGHVVPERQSFCHAVAQPVACAASAAVDILTQHLVVPLRGVGDHAQSVFHLVHDGSATLVRCVRTHVHPGLCLIVAISRLCACTVGNVEGLHHRRHVVEVVAGCIHGIGDAFLRFSVALVVEVPGNVALRNGIKLHHVAIAHGSIGSDDVGTHEVFLTGRQFLQPVDATAVVQVFRRTAVVDGWFCLVNGIAESLLLDQRVADAADGHSAEGHGGSTDKAFVGGYVGRLCHRTGAHSQ